MRKLFYLGFCLVIISCSKKNVPTSEKKQQIAIPYTEDLSELRYLLDAENTAQNANANAKADVQITNEALYVNEKVESILNKRTEKNKAIKYANGYRIQVYVGRERKIVDDAKVYIYQTFPNINPYLSYNLPIYKLKIGDFLTKADAERILSQISNLYPEAIIVPEKIDIKKSFLKE